MGDEILREDLESVLPTTGCYDYVIVTGQGGGLVRAALIHSDSAVHAVRSGPDQVCVEGDWTMASEPLDEPIVGILYEL